jgi:hypothetical protein
MERTAKLVSEESAGLSEEQKKKIADIEAEFRAKVAEGEIMLEQKVRKALSTDPGSAESLMEGLREEFLKDKEEWEAKKNRDIGKVREKEG